jgi:hypothetical protein
MADENEQAIEIWKVKRVSSRWRLAPCFQHGNTSGYSLHMELYISLFERSVWAAVDQGLGSSSRQWHQYDIAYPSTKRSGELCWQLLLE